MNKVSLIVLLTVMTFGVKAESIKICLAPIAPATSGQLSLSNPTARKVPYNYEVAIGGKKFSQDSKISQCAEFSNEKNILVSVKNNGEAVESFYVKPDKYKSGACVWFKSLYSTWSAWGLEKSGHLCK